VGTKELEALIEVLQGELEQGRDGHVIGSWTIRYDKERTAFTFDKCEDGIYCEERPAVIGLDSTVIDAGGPLLG
jgi:hypothetical protein